MASGVTIACAAAVTASAREDGSVGILFATLRFEGVVAGTFLAAF